MERYYIDEQIAQYKDVVGKDIVVLNGEGIPNYCHGWYDSMEYLIGNIYEVQCVVHDAVMCTTGFRILDDANGSVWTIDVRGCKIVNTNINTEFKSMDILL